MAARVCVRWKKKPARNYQTENEQPDDITHALPADNSLLLTYGCETIVNET